MSLLLYIIFYQLKEKILLNTANDIKSIYYKLSIIYIIKYIGFNSNLFILNIITMIFIYSVFE